MIVPLLLRNSYRFSHHNSKYSANKNYYSVLKIPHNSTKDAIKNAFIGLAKKYHPDLNPHGK
jgi:molecular chaperone DnaJ